MKIALIPIDNRPICYDLAQDILSCHKNIELFMPDIKFLGGLKTNSNIDEIFKFMDNLSAIDYLIVSLDTIAYGGLVNSRRCDDSFETIKNRVDKFFSLAKKCSKKILAFSSVMRISNNNINEEEKSYWSDYGTKIFKWSYEIHKNGSAKCDIPDKILNDYLNTRKRNFEINKIYLNYAHEGFFDTLIFSKDDCAPYGINVKEALELEKLSKNSNNILVKTGADEIPLSLISRAVSEDKNIAISPIFIKDESKNLISKYEDITLFDCVKSQIELAGLKIDSRAKLNFIINNFEDEQGDLVLGDRINKIKSIPIFKPPYFIADVNNANGADDGLIEELLKQNYNDLYGYCGYNTSANTIGCTILSAITKYMAQSDNAFDETAFKKLQFIRLLDDWAYQAHIRKYVREKAPDFNKALKEKESELNLYAEKIARYLSFNYSKIEYSLPWNRSFEIRIKVY